MVAVRDACADSMELFFYSIPNTVECRPCHQQRESSTHRSIHHKSLVHWRIPAHWRALDCQHKSSLGLGRSI